MNIMSREENKPDGGPASKALSVEQRGYRHSPEHAYILWGSGKRIMEEHLRAVSRLKDWQQAQQQWGRGAVLCLQSARYSPQRCRNQEKPQLFVLPLSAADPLLLPILYSYLSLPPWRHSSPGEHFSVIRKYG